MSKMLELDPGGLAPSVYSKSSKSDCYGTEIQQIKKGGVILTTAGPLIQSQKNVRHQKKNLSKDIEIKEENKPSSVFKLRSCQTILIVFFDKINAVKYLMCHIISKIIIGEDQSNEIQLNVGRDSNGKKTAVGVVNNEKYSNDPRAPVCRTKNNVPQQNVLTATGRDALTRKCGSGVEYRKT